MTTMKKNMKKPKSIMKEKMMKKDCSDNLQQILKVIGSAVLKLV
jgi:hypothetical protein